ncbi:MAG: preprotein translocase subunit SecG [Acidobacteriota bacterium]|nr:preprotein translocase subunit SecG [Acidobacteriota bacterium]
MTYFLYTLFFTSCVVLIASVLLQPGKTDAGALFTSNISSTAFSPRGSQTILSKMTIVAATTFMLSALLLAMPALTGNLSVLETSGAETTTETTTAPPTDGNTNTAVVVDANANTAPSNTAIVVDSNQITVTNTSVNANTANVNK